MSKRFLGPFLSFWEPILGRNIMPKGTGKGKKGQKKDYIYQDRTSDDPNETFENFYKDKIQNPNNLNEEQKAFFEKYYPDKFGKKFNAYQELGVDENADLEAIKEAYRKSALRYHPKVDSSPEARAKFESLSRAFNELSQKQTDDYGEDISTQSFFKDFDKQVERFVNSQEHKETQQQEHKQSSEKNKYAHHVDESLSKDQIRNSSQLYNYKLNYVEKNKDNSGKRHSESKQNEQQNPERYASKNENENPSHKKNESQSQFNSSQNKQRSSQNLKGAQLYSQSSFFEFVDGKRKLHITRTYGKDGRIIKVDRIQDHKPDGSIQVSQSYDDGKQVKTKKFVTGQSKKEQLL